MAKIMLVDDAAFMRMMIKKALSSSGYNDFIEAQDGAEAVKKYSEEKPDMVIMDITMPNMDGLQALKKIREGDPNAKVVMCTAMGQESMVVDAIKSGARDFVVKPFDAQRIVKTVNDILCVLKLIFSYIKGQSVKTNCNFHNICVRQEQKQMRVLSTTEQKKLTEFLTDNMDLNKLGVYLSLYTGIGELCALKWKNIKLKDRILHIDKTMQRIQIYDEDVKTKIVITPPKSKCSERDIPLPKFLCDILKKFKKAESNFLLSGSSEHFIEPRMLRYTFGKYMKSCNLENVNFHALRHTFATRCVESGFEIKTLSEILGHSSVKITLDRYVHSSMELKRKNMEKLESIF